MDLVGSDLRSSAALIIAGIIAEGTSRIYGLEHLDRGYENFESKLKISGVKIVREHNKKTLTNKEFKMNSDPADIPRYKVAWVAKNLKTIKYLNVSNINEWNAA